MESWLGEGGAASLDGSWAPWGGKAAVTLSKLYTLSVTTADGHVTEFCNRRRTGSSCE